MSARSEHHAATLPHAAFTLDGDGADASSLQPLLEQTRAGMEGVNALILSQLQSDVDLIEHVSRHLIDSGGKRIRPVLTLLACEAFGHQNHHAHLLAAAVEYMHTATLLHDDVVDESDLRRGKKTARLIWGNQASVLVGDFLLGHAFRMMVDTGSLACLKILSEASAIIASGEVMQLQATGQLSTTQSHYFEIINAKTAALFAAACAVGPALGCASQAEVQLYHDFGTALGLAFQLTDDVLDYTSDSLVMGKGVGDDLREGKVTLPVILALQQASASDRAFWQQAIEERSVTDDTVQQAILLLTQTGALDDTRACALEHAERALLLAAQMPPRFAPLFANAARFAVARLC